MIEWAKTVGPECAKVVENILQDRPHPEMGFRSCLGIIRLAKAVETARLKRPAAALCITARAPTRASSQSWTNNWTRRRWSKSLPLPSPKHPNLRGGPYYN